MKYTRQIAADGNKSTIVRNNPHTVLHSWNCMLDVEPYSIGDMIVSQNYWNHPLQDDVHKLYKEFEEAFALTGITPLFCPKKAFCEILIWRILGRVEFTIPNPMVLTKTVLEINLRNRPCENDSPDGADVSEICTVGLTISQSHTLLTLILDRSNMEANNTMKPSLTKCYATAAAPTTG